MSGTGAHATSNADAATIYRKWNKEDDEPVAAVQLAFALSNPHILRASVLRLLSSAQSERIAPKHVDEALADFSPQFVRPFPALLSDALTKRLAGRLDGQAQAARLRVLGQGRGPRRRHNVHLLEIEVHSILGRTVAPCDALRHGSMVSVAGKQPFSDDFAALGNSSQFTTGPPIRTARSAATNSSRAGGSSSESTLSPHPTLSSERGSVPSASPSPTPSR